MDMSQYQRGKEKEGQREEVTCSRSSLLLDRFPRRSEMLREQNTWNLLGREEIV